MCGIAGIVGQFERGHLSAMNRLITHRGPDDAGEFISADGEIGLAMRRLSIVDLGGGHQPMPSADGSLQIVFNGEIFNAPELRTKLEKKGRVFKTRNSDTEVILQLYEVEGTAMLPRLNGMFAFVIFDRKRNQLFGARDRFGIKPLYYTAQGGCFAFASEMKSLLTLPWLERQLDSQSLYHYLTLLHVPDEASILKGVFRLPPAHSFTLDVTTKQLSVQRFWEFDFDKTEQHTTAEWADRLRGELRAAVKRWSLSDVPIACSLSGGLDSSAVVGLLAEQGFNKLKTFTLGFESADEQSWDERHLAKQVASKWGTEHRENVLQPDALLDDLVSMVWHLDEPYGGGLPSWYVFGEMAREVKVGLTGSGGDELFGNYGKFRAIEGKPLRELGLGLKKLGVSGKSSTPFGRHYHAIRRYFDDTTKRDAVLASGFFAPEDTAAFLQKLYDAQATADLRNRLAALDFRTQLAEEFLFMTDRFSMAHCLEARVPLLDNELVETVFRIPSSIRTRPKDLKYLFKLAVKDLLPPDVLAGKKKGFVIPVELWLRRELRPLVERLLAPERLRQQGIFRPEFFKRFVTPHLEGRASFTWQIWAVLMFQLWHVLFLERKLTEKPTFNWKELC
jgi:asparagine synthase (glutamine-hydrolysing)